MSKNDWVFVGIRLSGLYFALDSLRALPGYMGLLGWGVPALEGAAGIGFVSGGLGLLIGVVLFLGAPTIAAWLEKKDERADS